MFKGDFKMCRFSIIVPCYNITKTVDNLFDKLSTNNYSDYEVIFVDDCSTDETYIKLCELTENKKNFNVYQTSSNGGPGVARNVGLQKAIGEYIIFCDSDDIFEINSIISIDDFLNKNLDADMLVFPYISLRNGKEKLCDFYKKYENAQKVNRNDVILGSLAPWAKVYKNSIIKEKNIEFPARMIGEDICFTVNYLVYVKNVYKVDIPIYKYVRNKDSVTHKMVLDVKIKTTFEVLKEIYKDNFPEIEVEMFVRTHLMSIVKQMCAASIKSKEIATVLKKENAGYPNWIKKINLSSEGLYKRIVYKAMYKNRVWLLKIIMFLRKKIY